MKYTNKHNYPNFVQEWLKFDEYDYDANTISATTLMKPVRAYALEKRNWENIEIDINSLIKRRCGTALHDSIEKINLTGCRQEERLRKNVMNKTITGKFDILENVGPNKWQLIDVKETSVYSYIYGTHDEDWKKQLSMYRWLGGQNNINIIQKGKIWMVFTDWSQNKANSDPKYPQSQIIIKEIDLFGDEETLKYIGKRIELFNKIEKMEETEMPLCTDKELWAKEDIYQIVKGDNPRSMKNCKNMEEAEEYMGTRIEKTREGLRINLKKGGVNRCKYCTVRRFCGQYKILVEQGRSEEYD